MKSQSIYFLSAIFILLLISAGCGNAIPKEQAKNPIIDTVHESVVNNSPQPIDTASLVYEYPIITDPTEKYLLEKIANLPDVISLAKYIYTQTNGKHHLVIPTNSHATLDEDGYYSIQVSEDNGVMLVVHYYFHVYPHPWRIMYYDIAEERELTLEDWRKEGKSIKNKKHHQ